METSKLRQAARIKIRYHIRRSLNRIDNEQLRRARGLLKTLKLQPLDVLYLGDSTTSFVGSGDTDRRQLKTMIGDALGTDVSYHVVDGPSFSPDIYDAYLQLLRAASQPPLVIVPLCVRVRVPPWIEHPVHGHKRALQELRKVDPFKGAWRVHAAFPSPTQEDFDEHRRVPYSTLLGEGTVDDYVSKIGEYGRSGRHDERVRMLYAYHHGGLLKTGSPAMEAVTRMGCTLRELGAPSVVYQTPVPVEKAVELFGTQMAERTAESFAVLNAAYRLGAGTDAPIIECGTSFSTDEFIDPSDASEHLNETGRRRLTDLIVTEVRARAVHPLEVPAALGR
jgi:hypothetical protein